MSNCYRCDDKITTDNQSNACSGVLKSKKLLCKTCNSKYGHDFDNKFSVDPNTLSNILVIRWNEEGKTGCGTDTRDHSSHWVNFHERITCDKNGCKNRNTHPGA